MIAAFWPKDAENPLVVLDLEAEHQVIELLDKAYIKKREGEWHEAVGYFPIRSISTVPVLKELTKHVGIDARIKELMV